MKGEGCPRNWSRPFERSLSIPDQPTLFGDLKADTKAVPGSGCHGLDCLPLPRRTRRRAER